MSSLSTTFICLVTDLLCVCCFQEDALEFFKEEKVDGAVYNVYLKKVRYHSSSLDDVGITNSEACNASGSRSRFYLNLPASTF